MFFEKANAILDEALEKFESLEMPLEEIEAWNEDWRWYALWKKIGKFFEIIRDKAQDWVNK